MAKLIRSWNIRSSRKYWFLAMKEVLVTYGAFTSLKLVLKAIYEARVSKYIKSAKRFFKIGWRLRKEPVDSIHFYQLTKLAFEESINSFEKYSLSGYKKEVRDLKIGIELCNRLSTRSYPTFYKIFKKEYTSISSIGIPLEPNKKSLDRRTYDVRSHYASLQDSLVETSRKKMLLKIIERHIGIL